MVHPGTMVITGGAQGIGRITAETALREGFNVEYGIRIMKPFRRKHIIGKTIRHGWVFIVMSQPKMK